MISVSSRDIYEINLDKYIVNCLQDVMNGILLELSLPTNESDYISRYHRFFFVTVFSSFISIPVYDIVRMRMFIFTLTERVGLAGTRSESHGCNSV